MRYKLKYHLQDYYEYYMKDVEKNTCYDVSRKVFHAVVKEGMTTLFSKMFEKEKIKFEPNIGTFQIMMYKMDISKPNKLPPDWKFWHESGKTILRRLTNEHSGGFRHFIKWEKPYGNGLKNKNKYGFKAVRSWNKKLFNRAMQGDFEVAVFCKDARLKRRKRLYKVHLV